MNTLTDPPADSPAKTTAVLYAPTTPTAIKPEFIRLPKPATLCPYTGLTRSKMNELVLPCEANGYKPPVASRVLRKRGQLKGVRLIFFDSLMDYLRSCPDGATKAEPAAA